MNPDLLQLFTLNSTLTSAQKRELVLSYWQYLTFDSLFSDNDSIQATELSALLLKYGPCWIDVKNNEGRKSVVVADITTGGGNANTIIKYYDSSDISALKECNFSDFIQWVQSANPTDTELKQAIVRLRKSPYEGADVVAERKETVKKAIEHFADTYFKDADDINTFFRDLTGDDFCPWFRKNIAKKGPWGTRKYSYKYDGKTLTNSRKNYTIPLSAAPRFNTAWDHVIGQLSWDERGIHLFQFMTIVSININETGGKFTIAREGMVDGVQKKQLDYFFKKYDYEKQIGKKIKALFSDKDFLIANLGEESDNAAYIEAIDRALAVSDVATPYNFPEGFPDMHAYILNMGRYSNEWENDVYPEGFPVIPSEAGILAEADFFKCRGRGLTQLTTRANYEKMIKYILAYTGDDMIIQEYKLRWSAKYGTNASKILTCSSNRDWDTLFLETNYEIAGKAIDLHQKSSKYLESMSMEDTDENYSTLTGNGTGSFYFAGIKMAGGNSKGYGDVLRDRVLYMLDNLNSFKE